jgi:hypothetical protein
VNTATVLLTAVDREGLDPHQAAAGPGRRRAQHSGTPAKS